MFCDLSSISKVYFMASISVIVHWLLIHGGGFFYYSLETKFYTCWMQMRWAKKNIFCGVIMMCFDANVHQCSSINDFLIRYYHIMSHMKV